MSETTDTAARALACLDLTNLDESCDDAAVRTLCRRALTPHGPVAAVCVWPRFVSAAKAVLEGSAVRVAAVVNFPHGTQPAGEVAAEAGATFDAGADEIDMVVPYAALAGERAGVIAESVAVVRKAVPGAGLKAILETGELKEPALIHTAACEAIEGGADFIKTSTGKVAVNATPEAAKIMLDAIRTAGRPVGLKPSGGIRTAADAAAYIALADAVMGHGWAAPARFRIGASGVLEDILAIISGSDRTGAQGKEY